jgi:hypothetical protein
MTMKVTKMVSGKEVEVPLEQVWDSICRIISRARLAVSRGSDYEKYQKSRIDWLEERLDDVDGLTFHDSKQSFKKPV